MNDKKEDEMFWALLRIVGRMHRERYEQDKKKALEIDNVEQKTPEKPKKRKKRKSKTK